MLQNNLFFDTLSHSPK